MGIYMETTTIPAERTAQEIHSLLVHAGARQVLTEYNDKSEITGIHFIMIVNGQTVPFKMPVRTDALYEHFLGRAKKKRASYRRLDTAAIHDKAKRVAWRQLLRWVEAQLAFIDAGMADTEEVFMPYIQVAPNETLYQRAIQSGFHKLLPASGC